jgi:hypothetical protein
MASFACAFSADIPRLRFVFAGAIASAVVAGPVVVAIARVVPEPRRIIVVGGGSLRLEIVNKR